MRSERCGRRVVCGSVSFGMMQPRELPGKHNESYGCKVCHEGKNVDQAYL